MSKDILATDRANIWHPYASAVNPPPVLDADASDGAYITLDDGTRLIDGISSWWCAAHGHSRPSVVQAIRDQAARLPHVMFAGFTHKPAAALAERLNALMPNGLNHYFYADSGSIAVECALKMAIQYQAAAGHPDRCRIAALKGGYHGDTIGAMAVSDPGGMHKIFRGVLPRQFFAERPSCRFDGVWDDADFSSMETLLDEHADELAAVIVEPIFQGANAMWFYHPEYLRKLRAACSAHGILLIFDEIATGFGRTGRLFASEYAGVAPDIMTVGKALTAGSISLAVAAASDEVAAPIEVFLHGPTFMANPLACAAACASLDLLDAYDWETEVARVERRLKETLAPCRACPNVRDVRVLGAVGVLEVDRIPAPETTQRIVLETGVWLRPYDHFIYTMPPFVTDTAALDRIAAAMRMLADAV